MVNGAGLEPAATGLKVRWGPVLTPRNHQTYKTPHPLRPLLRPHFPLKMTKINPPPAPDPAEGLAHPAGVKAGGVQESHTPVRNDRVLWCIDILAVCW